jgi:hypothetical protein
MSFLWAAAIAITVIAGGALLRYGKPGNARDNAADASALWQWFIFLAAVGFGFWAALVYLRAAAGGDPGFGGLVHIAVAAGVLTLAVLATSGLLLLLGRFVQGKGRIAIAGMVSLVLGTGFLYPIAVEGSLHRRAADARRVAQFEAELAAMQARMKDTPHAPPGTVPEQLEVRRTGDTVQVTNRSKSYLVVNVIQVVPRGRQFERCWATAKGGAIHPKLWPGDSNAFTLRCPSHFADAPLEFRVWDEAYGGRFVFKSDSAFVPDEPKLWK